MKFNSYYTLVCWRTPPAHFNNNKSVPKIHPCGTPLLASKWFNAALVYLTHQTKRGVHAYIHTSYSLLLYYILYLNFSL